MFSECFLSLHLLILFLCFSFENNKRRIDKTTNIIYYQSILSPIAVFLNYFFNACISHNLFHTFFSYKSSFEKRIKMYKLIAVLGTIIILFFSIILNNNSHQNTLRFSFTYYTYIFIKFFYLMGLIFIIYIITNIFYILIKKEEFYSMIKDSVSVSGSSEKKEKKKALLELFVKRHIMMLIFFIIGFLPNNLILVIQTFLDYRICEDCGGYSFIIYLMSLSCTISFLLKMTEPYMMKYIFSILNFVLRKKQVIEN